MATQPRTPCHKLPLRFDRDDIIKAFFDQSAKRVLLLGGREGVVQSGSKIEILTRDPGPSHRRRHCASLAWAGTRLELLRRSMHVGALPQDWQADLPLKARIERA
jgi:MOSC domain-containing protein YiiM